MQTERMVTIRESDIQNQIRLALSPQAVLFRTNAGDFWQGQQVYSKEFGQMVLIHLRKVEGLPKGYSDLSGVRKEDGRAVFLEVKAPGGRVRPEQQHFLKVMASYGALAGVARTIEEAKRIMEGRG